MTGQLANVDLRLGEYLVSTQSRTTAGFWVLDGTPTRVPQETPPAELGRVIRAALGQSRDGPRRSRAGRQPGPTAARPARATRLCQLRERNPFVEVYLEHSEDGRPSK